MSKTKLLSLFILLSLTGCAILKEAVKVKKPDLSVESVRLAGLSFQDLDLVFDIAVDNPNPLPVTLARFDYDLRIEDSSFLKGIQEEPSRIAAAEKSRIALPLTLDFGDLRRTFATLKDQDSTSYELICNLVFDLPVLGERILPLRHSGKLPVVKPPHIEVGDLKIKRINLTSADLVLQLGLRNPNSFAFGLDRLDYNFSVGGKSWATGASTHPVQLTEKDSQTVEIPVSISFLNLGRSAYRALTKKKPLEYQLSGNLDLNTSLPLLPNAKIPIDLSGSLNVLR